MFRPLNKFAPRRTLAQHPREVGLAKHVAEKGLGVAGDPAVALRDRAFGIHGDELVGTVLLPDAGLSELFGRILPIDGTAGDTLRSQPNA